MSYCLSWLSQAAWIIAESGKPVNCDVEVTVRDLRMSGVA